MLIDWRGGGRGGGESFCDFHNVKTEINRLQHK